jgi:trans-aconitate 2-methyltransferase
MHKWDPADYQKSSSAQYNWAMALIAGLKLDGKESILDIGCGDGRITAHLAGLVPNGNVLGIDLSPEMIRFAAGKYADHPNLSFLVGDASDLKFAGEFDLVVSFACLHWVKDHLSVLKAVRQSLVPGGHFLMQCGGRGNAARILDLTGDLVASQAFPFPTTSMVRKSTGSGWQRRACGP